LEDNAVPFNEPTWWYGRGDGLIARGLQPLASAFGRVAMRRMQRADTYRSRLPVICIGNFTAGGTGKTPLTMRICEMLVARDERPVVLTRGYGGSMRGPHWVDARSDTATSVGDEPLLFARAFATVVARDRAAGARMIEAASDRASVIVMDDGMQNPGLAKDLAIAVVDARRGFGNGRVIPAGPLRAPLTFQYGIAHAIVVNAGPAADDLGGAVVGQLRQQFHGPVLEAQVKALGDPEQLTRRPLIAFAGIGAPQRFFDLLVREGGSVLAEHRFPDHHAFSAANAERLLQQARETGGQLITTEKDFARLLGAAGVLLTLREQSITLPIGMVFDPQSEQRLIALIDAAFSARKQASGLKR
jgi:tetraacyldisaccharide 4'-kinase